MSKSPIFERIKTDDRTLPHNSRKGKATPLLYTCQDAANACGVSVKTWRNWNLLGFTPKPIVIGKTFFWRVDELAKWIEAGCPKREEWEYRPPIKSCPFAG